MSLRIKLALSGTLLLALSLGLVTLFTLGTLQSQFDSQQQSRVHQLRPLLNAALSVPMLQRDYASVQAILEESLEDPALQQIVVHDSAGRLVASAKQTPAAPAEKGTASLADFRADLVLAGQTLGSGLFTLSRQDLDRAQARITRYVLLIGTLVLLVFSGLLWVFSGTVTRRLNRLVEASKSIRHGHYEPELPASSNDEVGVLVQAFSVMGSEIRRRVEQLHVLNQGLEEQVAQRTHDLMQRTVELDRSVRALETKTYLLNRAPFAVLVLDGSAPDFRILDTTDAVNDVFGHEAPSLIGQPVDCLESPDLRGAMVRQLQTATESVRSLEWETEIVCGSGATRWIRCLAFALRDLPQDEGLRVALCLVDIQDLWLAREEQRRLTGELQESNKLQSVGLAIAGIAHDLNTPVGIALTASTKIRSVLNPILACAGEGDEADHVQVPVARLNTMHKASELVANNLTKAAALVAGLKTTTANATRTDWRKLALLPWFESLLMTLSPVTHRAQCVVRLTCPSDLATYTEPGSLGQAITNLVVNATVHAFEGRSDRELRIEISRVERQIVIRVSDNGTGMSAEASARVFSPFFTTRRESGGSGLGLFSARRVVEEVLGGKITMQTTPGEGTTFEITLPYLDRPADLPLNREGAGSQLKETQDR